MNEVRPPRAFRVLGPAGEPAPARRRGPGLAVLVIAAYAIAFFAALWFLRARSPLFRRAAPDALAASTRAPAPPPPAGELESRAALLEGAGLAALAREEYLGRLATDCCDCGCDMTLQECLTTDRTCARSREIASGLRRASLP
jgi:hypothetical protein